MFISNKQINAVVKVLEDNEKRLTDAYDYYYCGYDAGDVDEVLEKIAIDIIEQLNKVTYNERI